MVGMILSRQTCQKETVGLASLPWTPAELQGCGGDRQAKCSLLEIATDTASSHSFAYFMEMLANV